MSSILLIFMEDALSVFYEDELREFGLNAVSVNTIENAISILDSQQFDLIVLNPDVWDKQKLKHFLDRIKLLKSTRRNTKILVISSFSSNEPDSFGFADALVALGLGPEWLLAVCNLIGMDKQRVWDHYENKVKLMSGEHGRISMKHVTVFVCYALDDFEQVHPIYKRLSVSYTPWMDKENIVGAAMKNQGVVGGGVSGQEVVGMRRAREKGTRDRRSMEWDRNRSLGCQGG